MENETKKIEEKIEKMSIYEKLSHIQCELKAPKTCTTSLENTITEMLKRFWNQQSLSVKSIIQV